MPSVVAGVVLLLLAVGSSSAAASDSDLLHLAQQRDLHHNGLLAAKVSAHM